MLRIAQLGIAALGLFFLPWPLYPQSGAIVISQVYGGGGNVGATLRNDFIELFNPGNSAVNVTGWTLQYASASGSGWDRTALGGSIEPGQYYLVLQAQGNAGTTDLPAADAAGGIMMSATSGKVVLVRSSTLLTGSAPSRGDIADVVGYGEAGYALGRPTGVLSNTTAAIRRASGCANGRDNSADFVVSAPAPRNSRSPRNRCETGPPPDTTPPSVTITQPTAGSVVRGNVTIVASASDNIGVVAVQFFADGVALDAEDSSAPYALAWPSASAGNGTHVLTATARDAAGNSATSSPVLVHVQNESIPTTQPGPRITSVLNGASYMPGAIAPGQLITVFGSNLGPAILVRAETPNTSLAGTRLLVNGDAATVVFATATAVSAFVPSVLRESSEIAIEYEGKLSNAVTLQAAAAAPGIFAVDSSGRGQASAWNEDGAPNGSANPAAKGSLITILATGIALSDSVMVRIGDVAAGRISLATAGENGFVRVTAEAPVDLAFGGPVAVEIEAGDARSQPGIFIAIEGDGADRELATESRLRELRTDPLMAPLNDIPHDRVNVPADWLALVSWNIQVGGTSLTSDTRPPMVRDALRLLFAGSYQVLAAQEIPNADSSAFLRSLLPGGAAAWEAALADTSDSMDNGFYYTGAVKLRDSLPLFVALERDNSGRYVPEESKSEHPPQVAQFEAGDFDFTLITLHLAFADGDTAASAREFGHVLDYLDWYFEQPGHDPDVVVCGDFNIPSTLSGDTGRGGITLDSIINADPRFQIEERRFVVTVHEPTSRSPAAGGGGPARNYDHCVLSADTMEEFIQARRVETSILTDHAEDPEQRLTSDHFPIVSFFRTKGPGVIRDNRPTIRPPAQ